MCKGVTCICGAQRHAMQPMKGAISQELAVDALRCVPGSVDDGPIADSTAQPATDLDKHSGRKEGGTACCLQTRKAGHSAVFVALYT